MRFWNSDYTFDHPWEKVAQAAWRKYPNPMNPSVVAIDVLDRKIEDGGVLHTHRLISSRWGMPAWVSKIIGSPNVMYANEKSEVDVSNKKMVLRTRNITFCKFIAVDETLWYQQCPHDPEKTQLRQEAVVVVEGVPLNSYMENLLANAISSNAKKGRQAMEWVLKKINDEINDLSTHAARSLGDITESAKKSMDDLSNKAKKSIDDLHHIATPTGSAKPDPQF